MRTIKFRAYHKFLKKMLIPERLWLDDGMVTAFQAQGDSENVFQVKRDSEDYGLELMQSTGLEDKNGKEIYEGDIIISQTQTRVVKYNNNLAQFIGTKKEKIESVDDWITLEFISEVIGNIHETSELINR